MLPGLFSASGHVFYLSFISWGIILCLLLPSGRQDNMDGTALLLNYGAKGNIHECLLSAIFTILLNTDTDVTDVCHFQRTSEITTRLKKKKKNVYSLTH